MRLVSTVAIGLLVAGVTDATALVLCQKKRIVAARETCRRGETPLSLGGIGEPGAPGADGPQGPPGRPPLHLVDAAGTEVGPVVGLNFYLPQAFDLSFAHVLAVVRQPPLADGALLGVNPLGAAVGKLWYQSANCTGTPLIQGRGLMPVLQIINDTVFVPSATSAPAAVASTETNDLSQGCESITPRGGCCRAQANSGTFNTGTAITTLAELGIVPPLRAIAEGP